MEFEPFTKIPRLRRNIVITEKIDGTNAQIAIGQDGEFFVGSRNRWITPEKDNFGFAVWAYENRDTLVEALGPGRHYGEWWGKGIQRGYGLDERRFSLFNVGREYPGSFPKNVDFVPVLYQGPFDQAEIVFALERLRYNGSYAAPGFHDPEGIIIFHEQGRNLYKVTYEYDEMGKERGVANG